jgi:hypothetical protein
MDINDLAELCDAAQLPNSWSIQMAYTLGWQKGRESVLEEYKEAFTKE